MSLITYNNIADGTSIEAADLNAPINDIVNVINGNLDGTNISAGAITTSKMVDSANIETWRAESTVNFCASGCILTKSAGLIGAMTSGVVYIGGVRVAVAAIVSKTFTASKDTYVDVGTDGFIDYTEKANGAASQALEAGHFRLAKVITDGTGITNSVAKTTGPFTPSFQSGIDTLGNVMFNTDPYGTVKWYFPTFSNSWVDYDADVQNGRARYCKSKSGLVSMTGLIKSGTTTTATTILTLPVGYRPATDLRFMTAATSLAYSVTVNPSGQMNFDAGGATTWISLAPISFQATGGN